MITPSVRSSFRAPPKGGWQLKFTAIFIFMIGAFVASAQVEPATAGSIRGVLSVPAITARPITPVSVQIVETGQTAAGDESGRSVLSPVAPGTYTLLAAGEGFSRLRVTEVSVDAGQVTDTGRREMPILAADGKVQGGAESTQSHRETDVVKLDRFAVSAGK